MIKESYFSPVFVSNNSPVKLLSSGSLEEESFAFEDLSDIIQSFETHCEMSCARSDPILTCLLSIGHILSFDKEKEISSEFNRRLKKMAFWSLTNYLRPEVSEELSRAAIQIASNENIVESVNVDIFTFQSNIIKSLTGIQRQKCNVIEEESSNVSEIVCFDEEEVKNIIESKVGDLKIPIMIPSRTKNIHHANFVLLEEEKALKASKVFFPNSLVALLSCGTDFSDFAVSAWSEEMNIFFEIQSKTTMSPNLKDLFLKMKNYYKDERKTKKKSETDVFFMFNFVPDKTNHLEERDSEVRYLNVDEKCHIFILTIASPKMKWGLYDENMMEKTSKEALEEIREFRKNLQSSV